MKVMAINSSPRTQGESHSEKMLHLLVEGMRGGGAEVEIVNLREFNIKFCQGCYTCWTKTPGKCRLKDDMTESLFLKWQAADLVVYASPLYYRSVVSRLQAFIERTLPALLPYCVAEGERSSHPPRERLPNFVMLSVSGFPDSEEFGPLSDWAKANFDVPPAKLLAEIYRPGAQTLSLQQYRAVAGDIYGAVKRAGNEIIRDGIVSETTMARITQPIVEKDAYFKFANVFWQHCIDEKMTPRQFQKNGAAPKAKTVEDMMALLPVGINQIKTMELQSRIQFRFESDAHNDFFMDINRGSVKAFEGRAASPDLTIITPFQVWSDIMGGLADGAKQLMEGAYRIEGDGDLLVRLFA